MAQQVSVGHHESDHTTVIQQTDSLAYRLNSRTKPQSIHDLAARFKNRYFFDQVVPSGLVKNLSTYESIIRASSYLQGVEDREIAVMDLVEICGLMEIDNYLIGDAEKKATVFTMGEIIKRRAEIFEGNGLGEKVFEGSEQIVTQIMTLISSDTVNAVNLLTRIRMIEQIELRVGLHIQLGLPAETPFLYRLKPQILPNPV